MASKKELTKDDKIKKEVNRLNKILKEVDEKKKKTVEGLIKEAAFMRITLEELRDCINENGVIDEMCQGEYTINDKLLALLPKEVVKEADDGFENFVFGREDV